MKKWNAIVAMLAVAFGATFASAGEVKSGLETGAKIGPFQVVKVGGAPSDGVGDGDQLCYRCKNGAKPQVMVFTRVGGEAVAKLTKELNAAVAANEDKNLTAFVNVMGDKAAAEKEAKTLAAGSDKVPVVLPVELENGPANYGINPDADVTILIANKSTVVSSKGFKKDDLSAEAVAKVIEEVKAALK